MPIKSCSPTAPSNFSLLMEIMTRPHEFLHWLKNAIALGLHKKRAWMLSFRGSLFKAELKKIILDWVVMFVTWEYWHDFSDILTWQMLYSLVFEVIISNKWSYIKNQMVTDHQLWKLDYPIISYFLHWSHPCKIIHFCSKKRYSDRPWAGELQGRMHIP